MPTPLDADPAIVSPDQLADASVLSLLAAFDAIEHALRRLRTSPAAQPPAILDEALLRVDADLGDRTGDDLSLQLRALTDALRDLTPAALAPRSNFRPALQH